MARMSLRKKIFVLIVVMVLIICGENAMSFYYSYVQTRDMVNSARLIKATFDPSDEYGKNTTEKFFKQERIARMAMSLHTITDEIMAMNNHINHINDQLHRREIVWSGLLEISQSITSTLNFHVALERIFDETGDN